ncbi:family 43 glycosylhydrolase [Microbacterium sp. NPDC077663]|uniref:family 43 glycosylhydrolase n=1 Tax=Microbacterium sp. NPDC077663 TaxID=3364189 RepID=UPI0037C5B4F2
MSDARNVISATGETPSPVPGYFADPNLFVHGGVYWLYATVDGYSDWSATTFRAFSSVDLVSWTDHGEIFDVRNSGWASGHAWAPGHAEKNGSHYLYYTADRGFIGVAVAAHPAGPFIDLGRPLVSEGEYDGVAIDPSVFVDDDGQAYLWWGNGTAHCVPLGDDMTSFDHRNVISTVPEEFREAAWVHRRGDLYYLSWSAGDTRDGEYRVLYATGHAPTGPWTFGGVVVEKQPHRGILATGHHSIARIPDDADAWVIAYHRFAINGGDGYHREIRFDLLNHADGAAIQPVQPSASPLRLPLPAVIQN